MGHIDYPTEIFGWVATRASRSIDTNGQNYRNPLGEREFVIIGTPAHFRNENHIFKYNPHKSPGDRVKVDGFDSEERASAFAFKWMADNPIGDNTMSDQNAGLGSFVEDSSDEFTTGDEDVVNTEEELEEAIPDVQQHPQALLGEYSPSGEKVAESPLVRGIDKPGMMPAKGEWPDGWIDKTTEFERYEEEGKTRTANRKRVDCSCGLHIDTTETAFVINCYGCGRKLIDMNPADSPGETHDSSPSTKTSEKEDTSSTTEDDSEDEEEESSGLQAFVNENS